MGLSVLPRSEGKKPLFLVKAKRAIWRWAKITVRDTLEPLYDTAAQIHLCTIFIVVFIILPPKGLAKWADHLIHLGEALEAFVYALCLFAALKAVGACFKVSIENEKLGAWFGRRFVYHEPQRVLTVLVTEQDNETTHLFKVSDAEKGSLVETVIDIDSPTGRVKAQIVWPKGQNIIEWGGVNKNTRTSLQLPKDRMLGLRTNALPETSPVVVRVFVVSFEMGGGLTIWDNIGG